MEQQDIKRIIETVRLQAEEESLEVDETLDLIEEEIEAFFDNEWL